VKTGKAAHMHAVVEPRRETATRVFSATTKRNIRIAMSFVITEQVSLVVGANVPAGDQAVVVKVRIKLKH